MRNDFSAALKDTLLALHILGVDLDPVPTLEVADTMFEQVKNEILAVGFDAILAIPRTSEPRTDLAVALLGDAGTHAYWSTGEGFTDVIGLTVRFMSHFITSSFHALQLDDSIGSTVGVPDILFIENLFVYSSWSSSGMSPGTALGFFWALAGVHRKCLSAIAPLVISVSRCGTKGAVSVFCGSRKAGITYCRASWNKWR
jgi:hypothetical protein